MRPPITRRPRCSARPSTASSPLRKIGSSRISVDYPEASGVDRQNFANREAVRAIRRLEDAGYAARADILYRDLAQQLVSPGELALLAAMAEQRGDHFLALRVGKIAASRGIDIGALSHPVGVIPASADISGAGKALAYAIARQESEFNVGAVSGAGARGLLQLLPGTAREMAKQSGLPYSKARLTTDAGYNATLGAAFLGEQLGRFDGSYVLTFAGYNAGPRPGPRVGCQIRRSARQEHRRGRRLDRADSVHRNKRLRPARHGELRGLQDAPVGKIRHRRRPRQRALRRHGIRWRYAPAGPMI